MGREVGPPAEGAGGAGGGAGTFPSTIPGIMQDGDLRRFHAQTNRDTYYVQLVKEIKELGTESVGGESTEARAGRGPEVRVGTGVGEDEMRMNVKVEMETEEKRDDQVSLNPRLLSLYFDFTLSLSLAVFPPPFFVSWMRN